MPRQKQPRNVAKQRNLRANMSLPEVLLWQQLRSQSEVKFRRQHPLDPYVLEFYCAKVRVCFEIDGIAHDLSGRPEHDVRRDDWLQEQGIGVVRMPAFEVLFDTGEAAEALTRQCACK